MKFLLLFLAPLALLLGGCSTVSSRIEEKSAIFNTLDPQTQTRLKHSIVRVGDTTDMVYIALGRPDRTREKKSSDTDEVTWIYNAYWQEYEGSRFMGYQRRPYYNPATKTWRVYYEPVRAEVYRERSEEYMRVIFKDGRVSALEQQTQR